MTAYEFYEKHPVEATTWPTLVLYPNHDGLEHHALSVLDKDGTESLDSLGAPGCLRIFGVDRKNKVVVCEYKF